MIKRERERERANDIERGLKSITSHYHFLFFAQYTKISSKDHLADVCHAWDIQTIFFFFFLVQKKVNRPLLIDDDGISCHVVINAEKSKRKTSGEYSISIFSLSLIIGSLI